MIHDENYEGGEGHEEHGHCHHMHGPMKREFKLAMLEKKEKILKAELEFIGKMREILKKMPAEGKK